MDNERLKTDYQVTIGIPVYNVERHIRQTMDSALAQTFQEIEFLICDDCGTDGSIDIIESYQQNHPRGKDIHIIRQPHNMGIGAARNRMIAEAQGRYFYSLDADDVIREDTIELLYSNAQKYQAEIVYGSREHVIIDGDKKETIQYPYPFKVFTEPDEYANYVYNVGIQVQNWNYLIDIDILRRNHLQVTPVGHGYGEDFTFTVDLPTYITRAVLLPDITYYYIIEEKASKDKRHKVLSRQQMDLSIDAIDKKKRRVELKDKPYYAKRCSILMMYDYSFARRIVSQRKEIEPNYSDQEIRRIMWHPMSLGEILCSQSAIVKNLAAWTLSKLSPKIAVGLIKLSLRLKD